MNFSIDRQKIPSVKLIYLYFLIVTIFSISPKVLAHKNNSKNHHELSEVQSLTNISGTFSNYIPYAQFNNYEYQGVGMDFENQFTLLEYAPDSNGMYQIVSFTNGQAIAFVYQQRNSGLYELARFDGYGDVNDLRSDDRVNDGSESLILSSNLSLGYQFNSGYHNEYTRTIQAILPTYHKNGIDYSEVVAIEETGYPDNRSVWYYLAPSYGIICIEHVNSDGTVIAESSLVTVYNEIAQ